MCPILHLKGFFLSDQFREIRYLIKIKKVLILQCKPDYLSRKYVYVTMYLELDYELGTVVECLNQRRSYELVLNQAPNYHMNMQERIKQLKKELSNEQTNSGPKLPNGLGREQIQVHLVCVSEFSSYQLVPCCIYASMVVRSF